MIGGGDSMATTNGQFALLASAGYLLDQVRAGRGFFEVLDALLVVAVTQANIDPILRDPAAQRAYATYDAPPPDELRRSISVNALAQSLSLPFETVRRRVTRLLRLGILTADAEGLRTPVRHLRTPFHRKTAEAAYRRLHLLYDRLSALPEMSDLQRGVPWVGPPPLRAAARLSGEYLLRLVAQLTRRLGGPVDAAIWLEVLRSSAEPALQHVQGAAPLSRMPVAGSYIAKRLALPAETVRRRLANMVAGGAAEQRVGGFVIPATLMARRERSRLPERNLADLRRVFYGLAALGALPFHRDDAATAA